jgi:hypothetical protein
MRNACRRFETHYDASSSSAIATALCDWRVTADAAAAASLVPSFWPACVDAVCSSAAHILAFCTYHPHIYAPKMQLQTLDDAVLLVLPPVAVKAVVCMLPACNVSI